jgi:transcriptional regulator with XRE-family HTH domain
MDLREYLFRKKLTVTEFAKKINYGRTYVNEIITGNRTPGRKLAEALEKETNGEVTIKDLIG